jgi:ABC-type uncharacterized transport system substrate-binding protein
MPTLGVLREYAEAGLLTSYGPSYADHCRRAATYVDQILKGAKPADLPVQLATTFELVVHLKTAKVPRLDVPSGRCPLLGPVFHRLDRTSLPGALIRSPHRPGRAGWQKAAF